MSDEVLPAPAQLEAQLGKCKSSRGPTFYKSRVKSAAVSPFMIDGLVFSF